MSTRAAGSRPGSASARSQRISAARKPFVSHSHPREAAERLGSGLRRAADEPSDRLEQPGSSSPCRPRTSQCSAAVMRRRLSSSTRSAGVTATASSASSAAASAAPRARACAAPASRAAATSSSAPTTAIARWRARSSRSTSRSARRRWKRRLRWSGIARVAGGREKRMREVDPVAVELEHASTPRELDVVDGRDGERFQQRAPMGTASAATATSVSRTRAGKRVEALRDEGSRLSGSEMIPPSSRIVPSSERASELQRVERIPARRVVHAHESRSRQVQRQPLREKSMDRADARAARPGGARTPRRRDRGRAAPATGSPAHGRENADRLAVQSPQHEAENLRPSSRRPTARRRARRAAAAPERGRARQRRARRRARAPRAAARRARAVATRPRARAAEPGRATAASRPASVANRSPTVANAICASAGVARAVRSAEPAAPPRA